MIEEAARVIGLHGDLAEVATQRQTACGGCAGKTGCGTSLIAAWLDRGPPVFLIRNDIGAAPGDEVIIGLDEGRLQRGTLLLYALPLAGLLLGAVVGEWAFARLSLAAELGAVLTGLLGLVAALFQVRRVTGGEALGRDAGVRLLRVVGRPPSLAPGDIRVAAAYSTEATRKYE